MKNLQDWRLWYLTTCRVQNFLAYPSRPLVIWSHPSFLIYYLLLLALLPYYKNNNFAGHMLAFLHAFIHCIPFWNKISFQQIIFFFQSSSFSNTTSSTKHSYFSQAAIISLLNYNSIAIIISQNIFLYVTLFVVTYLNMFSLPLPDWVFCDQITPANPKEAVNWKNLDKFKERSKVFLLTPRRVGGKKPQFLCLWFHSCLLTVLHCKLFFSGKYLTLSQKSWVRHVIPSPLYSWGT